MGGGRTGDAGAEPRSASTRSSAVAFAAGAVTESGAGGLDPHAAPVVGPDGRADPGSLGGKRLSRQPARRLSRLAHAQPVNGCAGSYRTGGDRSAGTAPDSAAG